MHEVRALWQQWLQQLDVLAQLLLGAAELVDTLEDALFGAFRHRRHRVVFVLQRDVVVDGLVLLVHAVQAVFDDGR